MKTLVIGDIHGCLSTLKALIAKAGPVSQIISVGDLIDRGPDSLGVIKYCIENNIQVCLGNHELLALEALTRYLGPDYPFKRMDLLDSDWIANGGRRVFDDASEEDLQFMVDYFQTLPIYIKTDYIHNDLPVVISHTCLNNYAYDILNASQEDLKSHAKSFVWSRTQASFAWSRTEAAKIVPFFNIYGHTPTDYIGLKGAVPMISPTGINLDTGCVYTSEDRGKLTAVLLPSMEIIQQERL